MDSTSLSQSITGLSHSGFYVDDLDRTIDFYTKVLGAKLEWRNDKSTNPLIKMYIGDFGLSIIKRPPDEPKREIPHSIHWAYRCEYQTVEDTINHIRSHGIDVEGPHPHRREVGICSWFFMDPDEHRLEIEAKYPNNEMRDEMVQRCKDTVNAHLGMYGSDTNKRKMY